MPNIDQQKRARRRHQQEDTHSLKRGFSLVTQVQGSRDLFAFLSDGTEIEELANRIGSFGL